MQLENFLEQSAQRYPDKTALVCGRERLTYRDLDERANRLAHALLAAGVERGDRVVVWMENSVEAVVSIFATLKAGGVFAAIHAGAKPDKLAYVLNNCRAKAMVAEAGKLASLEPLRARTPHLQAVFTGLEDGGAATKPASGSIDSDLAALIYTSGSTGKPKGVMLSHLNVIAASTTIAAYLENSPWDVVLSCLPLSFGYGLYQVLVGFLTGGTVVLERGLTYPYMVIEKMRKEDVTGIPLVPTMAALLLGLDLKKHQFPALRYITNAGAALSTAHLARLREAFPGVKIFSMYGQAECTRVSYLPPEQLDARPASVGRGMANQEVYLVDESGKKVGPGVVGQLVVRGSHVMRGYWEMPEETDAVLQPGPAPGEKVLWTGDLFRMDEEGYLYFVSRKDDLIKVSGHRVSPKEVEDVLYGMEEVAEAVVVGRPDRVQGQAIHAVIRPREGAELSERDVQRYCAQRLEDHLVPKSVEFRAELPKTASGKIVRREMKRFSADALRLDLDKTTAEIVAAIREHVFGTLRRKGVVVGLSGGIDSSVVAALCVRALGPERVLGVMMPETDSASESLRLGVLVADSLGIETHLEDIREILEAAGCYRRRNEAIREVLPEFDDDYRCKIVLPDLVNGSQYAVYSVVAQGPVNGQIRARLTTDAYLGVVAATNFKQRTRKMIEYYWADRMHYAVAGTPNRLEYDQGFFVKNGDGSADLKPIAHLLKGQVYQLAEYLGVPEEIRSRRPTTDTYSLEQSQEEFYFSLPYEQMDVCVWAKDHGVTAEEAAPVAGLTAAQVERAYQLIDARRKAARYLHAAPLLVG